MPKLNTGITKFKKQEIRRIGEGFGGYIKPSSVAGYSVCDEVKAQDQGKNSPRKRFSTNISNIGSQQPRDISMYTETDFLGNI